MTRPDHISRGGELSMLPPLALQNATMYSFACVADQAVLQAMVDAQLNAVAGAGTYTVLGPFVAIVCTDIAKSFSTTAPDSQKGWMSERDFGVWVPVIRAGTILWYLPYVFVDNVAAMVTGRDVFGFFKQTAVLGMPASPQAGDPFTVDALVIECYDPSSQAHVARLLTLASPVANPGGGTVTTTSGPGNWATPADAANALSNPVAITGQGGASVSTLLKAFGTQLASGVIPMVFLKQIRGCTATPDAAYQAVVEAPARLDRWTGGWFARTHHITILRCDSHPIARECGLPAAPFSSAAAFWCQMDFTMLPGAVVAGG